MYPRKQEVQLGRFVRIPVLMHATTITNKIETSRNQQKMMLMNKICYPLLLLVVLFSFVQSRLIADENQENRKKAIIFGATGQDGTYLTELLLSKNYEVHGVARHAIMPGTTSARKFTSDHYFFHIGDVTNYSNVIHLLRSVQPDEIYNLAAQSRVQISFDQPEETAETNGLGTLRILEAIRMLGLEKKTKFFQAASSEVYGMVKETPQTEKTPFYPSSPYGVAKLYAYWITVNYRESYGMYACNGILFNHESPLRGESFVTRKISLGACRYKLGFQDILYLGNLDAKRDWGYAKDYVEAMWLMLQQDIPDDYVISTGEAHSVREFAEQAYKEIGVEIEWHGEGIEEYAINKRTREIVIKVDPQFYRSTGTDVLLGKSEKAQRVLNWKPKTSFQELVKIMVEADCARH